jgi:hypothetical protein
VDLGELREAVYLQLRDSAQEFVTPEQVDAWINEGLRDLAQRWAGLYGEEAGVTTDGAVAIPDDLIRPMSLRLGTDDVNFDVTQDEWFGMHDSSMMPVPTAGRVFGNSIELYPPPTDGTAFVLRYVRMPEALADEADVPELPLELHDKLVQFATARGLYKEREDALADRYRQEYEHGLPRRTLGAFRKAQPPTFRFEPGPFDLDPEARHISL